MKKILIVDDHPAFRMAIKILVENNGYLVCGESDNGVDAIRMVKELQPDLIVIDLGIPALDGIEVTKRIKKLNDSIIVLIISAQAGEHLMLRCFQAGADGFISKLDSIESILKAFKICQSGNKFFPRNITNSISHSRVVDGENIAFTLSDREMAVLYGISQGKTNKEMSQDMIISEKTISTYKSRVMGKLHVSSIVELVDVARRLKII